MRAQPREIVAGHRGRPDEVEARGQVGLAIFRERRDDIVDRLLRKDLTHGEDGRALVLQAPRDLGVGRDVELLPVDRDGHDRGVRAAGLLELPAVVLAVRETELGAARELGELFASELGVSAGVLVQAFEVLGRCDVVVDDRLADRELSDVGDDIVAHRVMNQKQPVAAGDALEVLPVAHQPADLGLGLPGEQIAAHARRPKHPLQLERVVANRVAVRDDGVELVREAKTFAHWSASTIWRRGRRDLADYGSPRRARESAGLTDAEPIRATR